MELGGWLDTAADSARELVNGALALGDATWRTLEPASIPDGLWGAYIPLLCAGQHLQLGILAHPATAARLARALLGMAPDEPLETDTDVFDAVGEMANLVAGGVKARVHPQLDVTLGIPLALSGKVFPSADSESRVGILQIERDIVWLVLTGTWHQ